MERDTIMDQCELCQLEGLGDCENCYLANPGVSQCDYCGYNDEDSTVCDKCFNNDHFIPIELEVEIHE